MDLAGLFCRVGGDKRHVSILPAFSLDGNYLDGNYLKVATTRLRYWARGVGENVRVEPIRPGAVGFEHVDTGVHHARRA